MSHLDKTLNGVSMLITGHEKEGSVPVRELRSRGAFIHFFPVLEIKRYHGQRELEAYLEENNKTDIVIFTSVNAVKFFMESLIKTGKELNEISGKIVAVGMETGNKLTASGIKPDMIPDEFSSRGVIKLLEKYGVDNLSVLIPASRIAGTSLKDELKARGARVIYFPVYDVGLPDIKRSEELRNIIKEMDFNWYTFTSPSSFHNFCQILQIESIRDYFQGASVAAIGPVTRDAIERTGLNVRITPAEHTLSGIAGALINYFEKKK